MAYQQSRRHGTRMSLEETLEQERRELVDLSEGRQTRHVQSGSWTASPRNNPTGRNTTMVDFAPSPSPTPGALPPRHGSIAGIGVGVTPPSYSYRRSWNEPISSSPLRVSSSAASSSSTSHPSGEDQEKEKSEVAPRRSSDGTDRPHARKRSVGKSEKSGVKATITPLDCPSLDTTDQNTPKRPTITTAIAADIPSSSPTSPTRAHEKSSTGKNTVAAMMSGLDLKVGLPSFTSRGRDSVRHGSARGSSLDSRLPSRLGVGRSISPRNRWLSSNPLSLATSTFKSNKSATDKGKVIGMDKRLSDTGSLSTQPKTGSGRGSSDAGLVSPGDERLEKDMYDSENNPIAETSDEEEYDESSSSDDESVSRGRKVSIDVISPSSEEEDAKKEQPESLTTEEADRQLTEEEKTDSTTQKKEPKLIHSAKLGPQLPPKAQNHVQAQVHPRTSFESNSAANTPFGSDDEAELSDIKRAQKLSIQMSSINNSIHNRSIRTIVRGDYANVQEEPEGGRRRRRRYMVTTDLSEESVYALEWTIGTILRDGDTMFAVCAIHEDGSGTSVQIGEGAKAMQDAAMVVGSQTEETAQKSQMDTYLPRALLSRLGPGTDSKPSSVDSKGMSKTESDRVRAVETISQTCVRLLRKTLLQVRIAVEVIHCKSPKHIITEAIDGLAPTLVIVGARGRSALKGVLLGSFSNYLVTHSSVPVMVARRKLKKQTKKTKTNIRLSNNLMTPKSLAMAKVD